jgi:ribosomal-protein-alanine N-acetyltransferase
VSANTLALRAYVASDRKSLNDLVGDPEVMQFVGDGQPLAAEPPMIDRVLAKYGTDPEFHIWAIEENGEYAGHTELKRREGRAEYELIYVLEQWRWGRGLGGAVLDLLLDEARSRTIPFVIATVYPENVASIAILRKRGFLPDEALSRALESPAFKLVLTE